MHSYNHDPNQLNDSFQTTSATSATMHDPHDEPHRDDPNPTVERTHPRPPLLRSLGNILTAQVMISLVLATAFVLLHTFSPVLYQDISSHLRKLITEDDGFATDTAIMVDRLEPMLPKASPPDEPSPADDVEPLPDEITIPPAEGSPTVDLSASTTKPESLWSNTEATAVSWSPTPKELLQEEAKEAVIPANAIVTKVRYENPLALPLKLPLVVTSSYGVREDPFTGEWSFHTGVDLRASEGTPIHAPLAGEVIAAVEGEKLGNYVKLRHPDGSVSVYGHCNELRVKEGDQVKKGTVIATVGSTGRSTGPHLHLGFLIDGNYVNPGYIFKDVPV